jgi:serine kinase of HPr protein (carbohydrate metabolism regulator)
VTLSGIGILLRGDSGSGKSDLALRLIDAGARLVSDDRVDLVARAGVIVASAPATIAGKLEVRGVGIVEMPWVEEADLGLTVDLVAPRDVERLPEPAFCRYLGVALPRLALAPFEASAVAKLKLAVRAAASGRLFADVPAADSR